MMRGDRLVFWFFMACVGWAVALAQWDRATFHLLVAYWWHTTYREG